MSNMVPFDHLTPVGVYSEVSLNLPEDLPYEDWASVLTTLFQIAKSNPWWIADCINYGEGKYGEKYAQALDYTSLDYATLRNYVWIARKYPKEEEGSRRKNLSFSHHKAAAPLPKQKRDALLDLCNDNKLSVKDLLTLMGKEEKRRPDSLPLTAKKVFKVTTDGDDVTVYELNDAHQVAVATFYSRKTKDGKKEYWDDKPVQTWYTDRFLEGLKLQGYLD